MGPHRAPRSEAVLLALSSSRVTRSGRILAAARVVVDGLDRSVGRSGGAGRAPVAFLGCGVGRGRLLFVVVAGVVHGAWSWRRVAALPPLRFGVGPWGGSGQTLGAVPGRSSPRASGTAGAVAARGPVATPRRGSAKKASRCRAVAVRGLGFVSPWVACAGGRLSSQGPEARGRFRIGGRAGSGASFTFGSTRAVIAWSCRPTSRRARQDSNLRPTD